MGPKAEKATFSNDALAINFIFKVFDALLNLAYDNRGEVLPGGLRRIHKVLDTVIKWIVLRCCSLDESATVRQSSSLDTSSKTQHSVLHR